MLIPPTVFRELQQSNTPSPVRQWAKSLPAWCVVQSPAKTDLSLDIDQGELEALCLAKEVNAEAVLMDDRAGRLAAAKAGWQWLARLGFSKPPPRAGGLNLLKSSKDYAPQTRG